LATPPLEMMVDLRGGVGPPPRDDGACQGGVSGTPPRDGGGGYTSVIHLVREEMKKKRAREESVISGE